MVDDDDFDVFFPRDRYCEPKTPLPIVVRHRQIIKTLGALLRISCPDKRSTVYAMFDDVGYKRCLFLLFLHYCMETPLQDN